MHFLKAHKPKWLEEGKTKFNELQTEEAETKIIAISAAEQSGSFNPYKERDQLLVALDNPQHHDGV